MLDEIEPGQFDELIAFREIEPDPDERLREIVRMGFKLVLNAQGKDVPDEMLDPWYEEPESDQDQVVSLLRSRHGARGQ
jgi:hypothetical protein